MQFIDVNFVTAKAQNHVQVINFDQIQRIIYILVAGYLLSEIALLIELKLSRL